MGKFEHIFLLYYLQMYYIPMHKKTNINEYYLLHKAEEIKLDIIKDKLLLIDNHKYKLDKWLYNILIEDLQNLKHNLIHNYE